MNDGINLATKISLPFTFILIVLPTHIFLGNSEHFDYNPLILLFFFGIHLFAVISATTLLCIFPKVQHILVKFFCLAGLFIFFAKVISPTEISGLESARGLSVVVATTTVVVLEIISVLALIILALKFELTSLIRVSSVLSVILFIGSLLALSYSSYSTNYTNHNTNTETVKDADTAMSNWDNENIAHNTPINLPNIYHIVLDAYDAKLFNKILIDDNSLAEKFKDFNYYPNAIANYTTTTLSVPSFMTGKLFLWKIEHKKLRDISFNEGVIFELYKKGYNISQYNSVNLANHNQAHTRVSQKTIKQQSSRPQDFRTDIIKLFDIVVLSAAPSFWQNRMLVDGMGLISYLINGNDSTHVNWTANSALASLHIANKLITDETQRGPTGHYVFSHLLIPHAPWVLEDNCTFNTTMPKNQISMMSQATCATRKMGELIDEMKKKPNYKNSLIIIHSDHGEYYRTNPLLMIKFPDIEQNSITSSDSYVQLLDIVPTISKYAKIKYDHLEGDALSNNYNRKNREIHIIYGLSKNKTPNHFSIIDGELHIDYPDPERIYN